MEISLLTIFVIKKALRLNENLIILVSLTFRSVSLTWPHRYIILHFAKRAMVFAKTMSDIIQTMSDIV